MNKTRRPFWLPASNYYVLAVAIALAFFFVVWGVLDDTEIRTPWQTAGVSASILLVGAVILRAIILRRAETARLRQPPRPGDRHKLTVERASAILADIRRKSDAANVLDTIASGHREVTEICTAFLQKIEAELPSVQAGSPRLAGLLRSRTKVSEIHRFHTLRWAEIEALDLSAKSRELPEPNARSQAAEEAVRVMDVALAAYPGEDKLLESRAILIELAVSVDVANTVVDAEHAAVRGDFSHARILYRDALLSLGRDNLRSAEREHAAARIREAMERLPFSPDAR